MENRTRINPRGSRLPSSVPPPSAPARVEKTPGRRKSESLALSPSPAPASAQPDIVCLSHLRWDFVFQRPQHLLTRFARESRVFYVEEPEHHQGAPSLSVTLRDNGV